MDEIIAKLKSAKECEAFEKNALNLKRDDLAVAARKRALEFKAQEYGVKSNAEKECLAAVYAYERVLSAKKGKRQPAHRTWQMIKRHGILGGVERAVNRPNETMGYTSLIEMGLQDYAFEAVVLRYPSLFSPQAVERSQARINEWKSQSLTIETCD
ncbi:MAG: hypothetical protein SFW62_01000 [Alphaproteobacteria bacterium]|nr:hypothetical protein [Alphaproteobacteria bacterium]